MMFAAIVLSIMIVILSAFLVLLKKEIRAITRQLKQLFNGTEKPVTVSFLDKNITALASEINEIISYQKDQKTDILMKEQQLKDAIINISHDLRTPLTSIIGYLHLLQNTDAGPEQREYIEIALSKSKDLRNLIVDFYDISVWEAKECVPELKPIRLDSILADSVLAYTDQFVENGITPSITFLNTPALIIADESMLKRVINNLISNAVSHGKDKLDITVSKGDNVAVSFQNIVLDEWSVDTDRLFDRFYTADSSRNHSGTGLGLYIVKLLMEKMGGTVKAMLKDNNLCIVLYFGDET